MGKETKPVPEIYPKIISQIMIFSMVVSFFSLIILTLCTLIKVSNPLLIEFWKFMAIASWSFLIGDIFGITKRRRK